MSRNDVTVMRVNGAFVDFLATDVGEDTLCVARIFLDKTPHLTEGRSGTLRVRVVEDEALPVDLDTCKTAPVVRR